MWSRTYGGTGGDYARSLVATSDGGYALAGYTQSFGAGLWDFWLVKTDAFGNMEWNQTYGGTATETAFSLVEASDGGYAVAGYTQSFGAGGADYWLVKTDAFGNMEWNKTYGGTEAEWACSLVGTSDGGYALAGYTGSFGAGVYDFWLVKTDALGNMEWNRTYGGILADIPYSLVATSDGGYALAGFTFSFGAGYDFWLVKTDALGNMEWNQTYGGPGGGEAHSLVEASDGGYALAGYVGSFGYRGPLGLYPDADFWLIKTDAFGNAKWNQTYGGTNDDGAYSLVATSDGGYALAGITYSFGAGSSDCWLVKTDEFGVVPEYSSWLAPSLVLVAALPIIIYRKRLLRTCS